MSGAKVCASLEDYYRLHARIYDATRWSFLFGREAVIRMAAQGRAPHTFRTVLEVGCGTGKNLPALRRAFPRAEITGVDLCGSMLDVARRKVADDPRIRLVEQAYDAPLSGGFDLILFSYALSMFNPGFEAAVACAAQDLHPGGRIAVADFHDTWLPPFRAWMAMNHVRMDGQILPVLERSFKTRRAQLRLAYGGVWRYVVYVGEKPEAV